MQKVINDPTLLLTAALADQIIESMVVINIATVASLLQAQPDQNGEPPPPKTITLNGGGGGSRTFRSSKRTLTPRLSLLHFGLRRSKVQPRTLASFNCNTFKPCC